MTDEHDVETGAVAERLRARRPALASERRTELRTRLLRLRQLPARPAHLWVLVLAFALSGLVLLALAAAQI